MPSPKISVIVPVYNMEHLMRRALDRLAAQSYRNYEVILVNDGSSDRSGEICEEYTEKYFNFSTIHKKNGGVSSARNAGLKVATGEWVTFCDPDDIPSVDWLANYDVEAAFDAELITQGLESDKSDFGIKRDSKTVSFVYDGNASGFLKQLMFYNSLGYTWCKLYRNKIIQDMGLMFDVNIRLCEDEIFNLNYLSFVNRVISHKEIGYYYFMPEWNIKYKLRDEERFYFNEQLYNAITKLSGEDYRAIRDFYIDSCNYSLMLVFSKTHERKCLRQIRKILLTYPNSTRLSSYLKSIITIDSSMTLSWLALFVHMKLKSMISR